MDLLNVRIAAEPDIARIRQVTSAIAEACELKSFAKTRIVTAVLEIARNALQHGNGGRAHFTIRSDRDLCWLVIQIVDQGEGLPEHADFVKGRRPYKAKSGGVRARGMGLGLTGVQRLTDRFDLDSSKEGTRAERYCNLTSGNSFEAGAMRLCWGEPQQRRSNLVFHGVGTQPWSRKNGQTEGYGL